MRMTKVWHEEDLAGRIGGIGGVVGRKSLSTTNLLNYLEWAGLEAWAKGDPTEGHGNAGFVGPRGSATAHKMEVGSSAFPFL